jgi:hypothetical protein
MIEQVAQKYAPGLYTTEKSTTSRGILNIGRIISPQKTASFEGIYRYMRIIDDLVDEHPYSKPVQELLTQERNALRSDEKTTPLQQEILVEALEPFRPDILALIKMDLRRIFGGMQIDLNIRATQSRLNERELNARHFKSLWSVKNSFSLGWREQPLIPTRRAAQLIALYGNYDMLCDLEEDLKGGLVLISREDLEKYAIFLEAGKPLPYEQLSAFYQKKSVQVAKGLQNNAGAVFEVGLPAWMAIIGYMYMQKRVNRLRRPIALQPYTLFQPPLDSLVYPNHNR